VTTAPNKRLSTSTFFQAGGMALLAAVTANLIARWLLGLFLPLAPDFQPFGYLAIIFFTTFYCLVGLGILALLNRFTANPLKIFNIVAIVGFIVTLLPNLGGVANPSAMPMGGGSSDYLILLVFHLVAIVSYLGVLNYVARRS
jgi:hypothetical protein